MVAICIYMSKLAEAHYMMILTIDNQWQSTRHTINWTVSISVQFSKSLHVQLIPSRNHRNTITLISSSLGDALERLANERRLLQFVPPQAFFCVFKYCCSSSAECSQDQLHIGTPYVEVFDYFHRTYVVLILPRFHLRQVKHLQCTRNS